MALNLQQVWQTTGITTGGKVESLYTGTEIAGAQAALVSAGREFAVVGIYPKGQQPFKVRRPSSEPAPAAVLEKPVATKSRK
jgi:hypothetical protein